MQKIIVITLFVVLVVGAVAGPTVGGVMPTGWTDPVEEGVTLAGWTDPVEEGVAPDGWTDPVEE